MAEGIQNAGKFLIIFGVILAVIGSLLLFSGRIPWIGRLPGDIVIQKKNYTIYVPLATSVIISLVLTLIFWIFGRK